MTEKTIELSWEEFSEMKKRVLAFKTENGRYPNYVDFKGIRIDKEDYLDAFDRVTAFKAKAKNGRAPKYVTVTGTILVVKSALQVKVEVAVGGEYSTATGFYNLVRMNEHYNYYYNDIYPQGAAIERLTEGKPLNCSDFSQIGYAVLKDLDYTVRYKHVKCVVSNKGHVFLQAKGKELGDSWRDFDLAAAAKSKYSLGNAWCANGNLVAYDPAWLMSDDGKT
jgi:hypothetical protein